MQQVAPNKIRLDEAEVTALMMAVDVALRADRALVAGFGTAALEPSERATLEAFKANFSFVERITVRTTAPVDVALAGM